MKKALQLASVASMIDQFNMSNIQLLLTLGYHVDVVADFTNPGTITKERAVDLRKKLNDMNVNVFDVEIPRTLNLKSIASAYSRVKYLIQKEHYSLIHCHSPVGGVICRQAAKKVRKKGTKVIYTAHGFHFYDGSPLKNWILFYPIEKHYSRYTDVLITINSEDYNRALKKFKAKRTVKIPGVGVDTKKIDGCKIDITAKRKELGVSVTDFLLLSVGELSERKNQRQIIEALHMMKKDGSIGDIVYLAVGKGNKEDEFKRLVVDYGLERHVRFLGYRTDIAELCKTADCFVHPSIREGLGIAPLEAMAAGLPLISSYVNGIKDYTEDGESGCCISPTDVQAMVSAIRCMRDNQEFRKKCSIRNINTVSYYSLEHTEHIMREVYLLDVN